jgi:hypothetical protein
MNKIIIIIILIIVIYVFYKKNNEKYTGAFIQLYSKDYQDSYLTDDIYNRYYWNLPYMDPRYSRYSRYNPFFWNAPTRFTRNSAPYLLLTPERFMLY